TRSVPQRRSLFTILTDRRLRQQNVSDRKQEFTKLCSCFAARAEAVLVFGAQFAHRAIDLRQQKDRVISEAAGSAGDVGDHSGHIALDGPDNVAAASHSVSAIEGS